jgi:hypothetical protein
MAMYGITTEVNTMKLITVNLVACLLAIASFLMAVPVQAWDPAAPPDDPDASWNPPAEQGAVIMQPGAEAKSSSAYYSPPAPGTQPRIDEAYFIDEYGQTRTEFNDGSFYLVVRVSTPGVFYVAEYYPADSGRPPKWLVYRHNFGHAGMWTLGPFYFESSEPAGRHAWRLWLYNSAMWANRVTGFNYQPYYQVPPVTYPQPVRLPESGSWSPLQVLIVAVLTGALGITIGMVIAGRRREPAG